MKKNKTVEILPMIEAGVGLNDKYRANIREISP